MQAVVDAIFGIVPADVQNRRCAPLRAPCGTGRNTSSPRGRRGRCQTTHPPTEPLPRWLQRAENQRRHRAYFVARARVGGGKRRGPRLARRASRARWPIALPRSRIRERLYCRRPRAHGVATPEPTNSPKPLASTVTEYAPGKTLLVRKYSQDMNEPDALAFGP